MILLLDSSSPLCKLTLIDGIDGSERFDETWQADRSLAKDLLKYLHDQLQLHNASWSDIEAIGVFEGPGSFTGLRIGLTVMNTIASSNAISIVGSRGDTWQSEALTRINEGHNDHVVMPFYGSDPHITQSRK